jgi:signal transduction histidine kinase
MKALEKEKELSELKSRFVTMACHEFKTPLATILSSSFLLENYSGEDFEKEKAIHTNRIKRSVNNLTMILNEFLLLEESRINVINSTIDIPNFIRDLINEMEPLKQQGQSILYQHEGGEAIILDPHLLWSIVTNLLSNALKYSKPNDPITLKTEVRDHTLTITGKDVGMGIPANELNNILGLFYRAKNAVNFDGTGLGLHIVDKNIKLLQGSISIKSELHTGTEFIVTLPSGETSPTMTSVALDQKI